MLRWPKVALPSSELLLIARAGRYIVNSRPSAMTALASNSEVSRCCLLANGLRVKCRCARLLLQLRGADCH
eukprot:1917359-Rhodomonas_salina.1